MSSKPRFVGDGQLVELGSICELVMGQSPSSDTYNADGEGLPFYQGNADFGEKNPIPHVWCTEPKKVAEKGDILISVRAPIGAINIASEQCCIGRGVAAIRPRLDFISADFLMHQLLASRKKLELMGTGSTFKAVGKKALNGFAISIYPKGDQDIIADQLDCIIQQIKATETQVVKLDHLVKSRFVEMFGNPKFEPDKWEVKPLGDVCATRLGKMLDAKKQTGECPYPYLANANVQWFRFELSNLRHMDFPDEDRIEFALNNGDVLVTEGGEVGRCAVWRGELKDCYFQKAVHRVRCDTDCLSPEYFVWCFKMKSDLGLFEPYISRSTIAHLTGKKIKQVPIPLPPLTLQQEFASFASQVDKSRFIAQQQIEKLQMLYDSLAQDYFGD